MPVLYAERTHTSRPRVCTAHGALTRFAKITEIAPVLRRAWIAGNGRISNYSISPVE